MLQNFGDLKSDEDFKNFVCDAKLGDLEIKNKSKFGSAALKDSRKLESEACEGYNLTKEYPTAQFNSR